MLGINAQTGQPLAGIDHLRQSIRDILPTRIGTRVMRRDYGSRLPALVDNPMTPRLAMDLYSATADALARWEPRFKLTRVRIASATVGQVVLDLEGVYLPDGKVAVLTGLEV
jgi:phage baseplate assembly protein W